MARLLRDTRFALRMLRKRWGITLVAMASPAAAIGGNTAVFSMVSALLLRPSSVAGPERVLLVQERLEVQSLNLSNFTVSEGTYAGLKERSRTAAQWAAYRTAQRGLRGSERAEPINVAEVTPGPEAVGVVEQAPLGVAGAYRCAGNEPPGTRRTSRPLVDSRTSKRPSSSTGVKVAEPYSASTSGASKG